MNTFNTVKNGFSENELEDIINKSFDLRIIEIVKNLNLKRPIYKKASSFG